MKFNFSKSFTRYMYRNFQFLMRFPAFSWVEQTLEEWPENNLKSFIVHGEMGGKPINQSHLINKPSLQTYKAEKIESSKNGKWVRQKYLPTYTKN